MAVDPPSTETAREYIERYYDVLRKGEPLGTFFANDEDLVKFGISEQLRGAEAVVEGLADQTATTRDWQVQSNELCVTERDRTAWFTDTVDLAWTAVDPAIRYEFETRWSGTLERRDERGTPAAGGEWRVVAMHVSTAGEL
jgi:hypothetical protein